jgi:hypothetical protein
MRGESLHMHIRLLYNKAGNRLAVCPATWFLWQIPQIVVRAKLEVYTGVCKQVFGKATRSFQMVLSSTSSGSPLHAERRVCLGYSQPRDTLLLSWAGRCAPGRLETPEGCCATAVANRARVPEFRFSGPQSCLP